MTYRRTRQLLSVALPTLLCTLLLTSSAVAAITVTIGNNTGDTEAERTFKGTLSGQLSAPSGFSEGERIAVDGGTFTALSPYTVTTVSGRVSSSTAEMTWGIHSGTGTSAGKFTTDKQAAEQSFISYRPGSQDIAVVSEAATTVTINSSESTDSPEDGSSVISATNDTNKADAYSIVTKSVNSAAYEGVLAVKLGRSKTSGQNIYLLLNFIMNIPDSDDFTTVSTPTGQTPSDYVKSSIDAAIDTVSLISTDDSVLPGGSSSTVAKLTSIKKSKRSVKGKALNEDGDPVKSYKIALACKVNGKYKTVASDRTNSKGRFKINVKKSYRDELRKRLCQLRVDDLKKRI